MKIIEAACRERWGTPGRRTPAAKFADNARYSWYAQPGLTITAFSPVTGETYTMHCAPAMTDV